MIIAPSKLTQALLGGIVAFNVALTSIAVHANGLDASYELFVREKLDALAGLRPRLVKDVQNLPRARVLGRRFTAVQQAVGTPKARVAAAAFLAEFIEEAKATGLVARLI